MKYAACHPGSVDKLILLNPFPASSSDTALLINEWIRRTTPYKNELEKMQSSEAFLSGNPEAFANYFKFLFRVYCALPQDADKLNLLASSQANQNYLAIQNIFDESLFLNPFDLTKDLKQITCKTLIIHCDKDFVPLLGSKNIHKNIKNSKLVIIQDCGHFPYVEKPEELFNIVETFVH